MKHTQEINNLLALWDSPEGHPYKGKLIDWAAYEVDPNNIGCMCAQGQALHIVGGWTPHRIRDTKQVEADSETAKLLNISRAHAVLLRRVNDAADGAPSIVLTHPEKILGDQARTVLAFWLALDCFSYEQWDAVWAAAGDAAWAAAGDAAGDAAGAAAWAAARDAARAAARAAAWDAARDAAWDAAWDAAGDAAWDAAGATAEIQGGVLMRDRGQPFKFLPLFGFANPEAIPMLPTDYGVIME